MIAVGAAVLNKYLGRLYLTYLKALLHNGGDNGQHFFLEDSGQDIQACCTALAHVPT